MRLYLALRTYIMITVHYLVLTTVLLLYVIPVHYVCTTSTLTSASTILQYLWLHHDDAADGINHHIFALVQYWYYSSTVDYGTLLFLPN